MGEENLKTPWREFVYIKINIVANVNRMMLNLRNPHLEAAVL